MSIDQKCCLCDVGIPPEDRLAIVAYSIFLAKKVVVCGSCLESFPQRYDEFAGRSFVVQPFAAPYVVTYTVPDDFWNIDNWPLDRRIDRRIREKHMRAALEKAGIAEESVMKQAQGESCDEQ